MMNWDFGISAENFRENICAPLSFCEKQRDLGKFREMEMKIKIFRQIETFAKMEKGIFFQPYGVHFRLFASLSSTGYFGSELLVWERNN